MRLNKLLCVILALVCLGGCSSENVTDATDVVPTEEAPEAPYLKAVLGTVTDETDTYMVLEVTEGEEEKELTDTLRVYYTTVHGDYLYGVGRRVVVYYMSDAINDKFELVSDDISTEGFRAFELAIEETGEAKFEKVLLAKDANEMISFGHMSNVDVSTYGINVKVKVDSKEVALAEALKKGYITPQAIVMMANRDVKLNLAKEITYRDGGSKEYVYENFKIIKYNTTAGKHDLYIGNLNMKYSPQ
ncbi:MAG: hypothetical protein IJ297_00430 [Clostridia bacterium]|nr:hypothetical protein [Clostridia bacterium]